MSLQGMLFEEAPGRASGRHWQLRIPLPDDEYINFYRDFSAPVDPLVLGQFVNAVEQGIRAWLAAQPLEPARMPATQMYYATGVGSRVEGRAS